MRLPSLSAKKKGSLFSAFWLQSATMVYVRKPRVRAPPAERNGELQPPKVNSLWIFNKKGFKKVASGRSLL